MDGNVDAQHFLCGARHHEVGTLDGEVGTKHDSCGAKRMELGTFRSEAGAWHLELSKRNCNGIQ